VRDFTLYTCEEEWRDNERNESCIPAGTYICRRTTYWKHNIPTFEVCEVPDRSRILFHTGNTEEDSDGCILLGRSIGHLEVICEETGKETRKIGVTDSRVAFRLFMEELAGEDEFLLTIDDPEWLV
jgi:hypothetical protein